MKSFFNLPTPGTIISLAPPAPDYGYKTQVKIPGQILKITKPDPVNLPIFDWINALDNIKGAFDDFQETECLAIIENYFYIGKASAVDYCDNNTYSEIDFKHYLEQNYYINRAKWLKCIDFLVKNEFIGKYFKLIEQQQHTFFTEKKYLAQQRKYLKQKKTLDLNTRVELDLYQEKEALKELTRINRPFLCAGKATAKNSKHVVCMSRKKSKKMKANIEDQSQNLEIQLELSQSIWEKNLKAFIFEILGFFTSYSKKRKEILTKSLSKSYAPILFYIFSAWIAYTRLRKDKKKCVQLASRGLQLSKALNIIKAWKFIAKKPARTKFFNENIQEYLKTRKLSRLFVSWKWFSSSKQQKDCMNILATKFFREKLKAKKFFELKIEVKIILGSRHRYQALAKGEDNNFNKDEIILSNQFALNSSLRKISQTLSRYQQEVFLLSQKTIKIGNLISSSEFYPKQSNTWKQWLSKKFNKKLEFKQ